MMSKHAKQSKHSEDMSSYQLDPTGNFLIRNYNEVSPFSNFFPGVAGLWGIPMWVFYVNRGQCISSFGIESKDKSILEFQPANKAWKLTSTQGFRTFFKIYQGNRKEFMFWEPFQNNGGGCCSSGQSMTESSHDLTIEDIDHELGLKIKVHYFTIPNEPFAALVRRVSIENISKKNYSLEMIDGLPNIIPFGMNDWLVKNMTRTVEAWVQVQGTQKRTPFYNLKVVVSDKPQVTPIDEGNFYLAFELGASKPKLLEAIVDPQLVFGSHQDFMLPENFLKTDHFLLPKKQLTSNRTPSAMSLSQFSLSSKRTKEFVSLIGYAHRQEMLSSIVKRFSQKDFIKQKANENQLLIGGIKQFCFTASSSNEFDQYCQQNFLDNVLRGGLPVSFKSSEGAITLNVFNRKHGDPERDYNFFMLAPTFFSQGNGNYRDVNQNRRNDVWFNKDVKEQTLVNLLNLIQADGYNPLIVKGVLFLVDPSDQLEKVLHECVDLSTLPQARETILHGFQPGDLLRLVIEKKIVLQVKPQQFLDRLLPLCHKQEKADHGEGFWTDHWTYNLDLIESFLSIYPEQLQSLLLEKKIFKFFFDHHTILPRNQRYIQTPAGIRQYHSVKESAKDIKAAEKGFALRINNGEGRIYQTSLIVKLLCLIANKIASLDPSGIGVEMEADKPNWYDALNGLPGLLGSSISESIEVKRLSQFLLNSFQQLSLKDNVEILLFEELANFVHLLTVTLQSSPEAISFFEKSNDWKETYRESIRYGISGREKGMSYLEIKEFLQLVVVKIDQGLTLAQSDGKQLVTYFYHEATEYKHLDKMSDGGHPLVLPLQFKRHPLPLFLEGYVHALRVVDRHQAKVLYDQIRKGPLFDKKLKMYKVNADLSQSTQELGRATIFPAGWLENESIWLHMEYKWMLEFLKVGLHEEFYDNFKNVLVPFLPPQQYGRSILENSSFIVSSAHEDSALHGRGFVARLSGSTAEFIHIWLLMNVGLNPFRLDQHNQVVLTFNPILPYWLFNPNPSTHSYYNEGKPHTLSLPAQSYAFNFLGQTLVVYHNPTMKDTFGPKGVRVQSITLRYRHQKKTFELEGSMIPTQQAVDIRQGLVERIDIVLK